MSIWTSLISGSVSGSTSRTSSFRSSSKLITVIAHLSFGQAYEKNGLSMTAASNETGPLRRPRTSFMIAIITGPDFTFNPPYTEFFTLLLLYYSLYFYGSYYSLSPKSNSKSYHNGPCVYYKFII